MKCLKYRNKKLNIALAFLTSFKSLIQQFQPFFAKIGDEHLKLAIFFSTFKFQWLGQKHRNNSLSFGSKLDEIKGFKRL